jgi:hypothetical protein
MQSTYYLLWLGRESAYPSILDDGGEIEWVIGNDDTVLYQRGVHEGVGDARQVLRWNLLCKKELDENHSDHVDECFSEIETFPKGDKRAEEFNRGSDDEESYQYFLRSPQVENIFADTVEQLRNRLSMRDAAQNSHLRCDTW